MSTATSRVNLYVHEDTGDRNLSFPPALFWRRERRLQTTERIFSGQVGRLGDFDTSIPDRSASSVSGVCANSHSGYEVAMLTLRAIFTIMPVRKEFSAPLLQSRSCSRKYSLCATPMFPGNAPRLLSFHQFVFRTDFLRRVDGGMVNVL